MPAIAPSVSPAAKRVLMTAASRPIVFATSASSAARSSPRAACFSVALVPLS